MVVSHEYLLHVAENSVLSLRVSTLLGQVIAAQNHILARHGQRFSIGRREDVIGREYQDAGLDLRFDGKRYVDSHLVAVKVGVKGSAYKRVYMNGLALHQDGLKGLDAEPVERWGAVEEHRVVLDNLVKHIPDLWGLALDHLFCALDRRDDPLLFQLVVDERLEKLEGHLLRQAALVEL